MHESVCMYVHMQPGMLACIHISIYVDKSISLYVMMHTYIALLEIHAGTYQENAL